MHLSPWHLIWLVPLLLWPALRWLLIPRLSPPPPHLLARNYQLPPCPATPNCVRSGSQEWPAWPVVGVRMEQIASAVTQLPGCTLQQQDGEYLHAICTSRLWGFIDDLELRRDPSSGLLHYRSASRLGYSDLGVNAQRLRRLQRLLSEAQE